MIGCVGGSAVGLNTDANCIIQAHRGAGNLAPENTLPSFELSWRIGTIPEADVRATADGLIVAFHDENLERLAPAADPAIRSKSVNELEWKVVHTLDVGSYKGKQFSGQHIPLISEILDKMRGHKDRLLYVDIKKVPLEKLADLVRERGLDQQVIMASTRYEEIREWKKLLPKSKTLLWMGGDEPKLQKRLAEVRNTGFADITQLQIHVHVVNISAAEPFMPFSKFLREVKQELQSHSILFQVLVLDSSEPEAYWKLMDLGINSFATDDPLVTLDMVRKHKTNCQTETK